MVAETADSRYTGNADLCFTQKPMQILSMNAGKHMEPEMYRLESREFGTGNLKVAY